MRNITCTTLLEQHDFALWKCVRVAFPRKDGYRLLYSVQPSLLIERKDVPLENQKIWFEGDIQLLVLEDRSESRPLLALVESDTDSGRKTIDLLQAHGLEVLAIENDSSTDWVSRQISELKARGLKAADGFKPITNDAEADFTTEVQRVAHAQWYLEPEIRALLERDILEPPAYEVLQEIAVDKVIKVRPDYDIGENLEKLREYARRARFDVLVTTRAPDAYPLLALEFDGFHFHSSKDGKRRDERKNRLCQEANLPLLRVASSDWRGLRATAPRSDKKSRGHITGRLFTFAVDAILERRKPDQLNDSEITQAQQYWSAVGKRFKELKRTVAVRTGVLPSGFLQEQAEKLLNLALEVPGREEYEFSEQERDLDRANYMHELATPTPPYSRRAANLLKELAERGVHMSEIGFKQAHDGLLGVVLLNRPYERIESPRFRLTGIGFDDDELEVYTKAFIAEWLYAEALDRLAVSK